MPPESEKTETEANTLLRSKAYEILESFLKKTDECTKTVLASNGNERAISLKLKRDGDTDELSKSTHGDIHTYTALVGSDTLTGSEQTFEIKFRTLFSEGLCKFSLYSPTLGINHPEAYECLTIDSEKALFDLGDFNSISGATKNRSEYYSEIFERAFGKTRFKIDEENKVTYSESNEATGDAVADKDRFLDLLAFIVFRRSLIKSNESHWLGEKFLSNWEGFLEKDKSRGKIAVNGNAETTLSATLINKGLVFSPPDLERIVRAYNSGKHIILSGAPGCGKTELAECIAIAAGKEKESITCTASPSWTSDDLIGRYLPSPDGKGLDFAEGFLLKALKKQDNILIIDEINRCDLDSCFGELFTVLSGKTARLPFKMKADGEYADIRIVPSGKASTTSETIDYPVSEHFRIIGTMNNYDRSRLHQFSNALKRRFCIIQLSPPEKSVQIDLIRGWLNYTPEGLPNYWKQLFVEEQSLLDSQCVTLAIIKDACKYALDEKDAIGNRMLEAHQTALADALALFIIPNIDPEQPGVDLKMAWNSIRAAFKDNKTEQETIQEAFKHTDWYENADDFHPGISAAITNWDAL
ncbi:MAG: AAA family ATPase [Roseibacillus sp.]